jgi:hypothetical protein
MTEEEWLTGEEPTALLLRRPRPVSGRKLRLFAVACCRRLNALRGDGRVWASLAVAERFAEGLAGEAERARAAQTLRETVETTETGSAMRWARQAAWFATRAGTLLPATGAARAAAYAAEEAVRERKGLDSRIYPRPDLPDVREASEAECAAQAELVREVIGNPFRRLAIKPYWLAWEGGVVRQLARTIDELGAYDRLPYLADALEEAGCTCEELLRHCRSATGHTRGCWAVDLLLGKS